MRWGALTRTLDQAAGAGNSTSCTSTRRSSPTTPACATRGAHGVPCVATYHTFFEEYLHHYVPVLPRALGRVVARHFTRSQCAAVHGAHRAVRADARGAAPPTACAPRSTSCRPGSPRIAFAPATVRAFRAAAGIAPDRPLVLYVGRVAHEKNIGFLIRCSQRVRERVPRGAAGDRRGGPGTRVAARAGRARSGCTRSVEFVGYLDRDTALLDCYAAADVFVFASRTETQGLVLLEAMAQGAPVVSTAELGTRSILQPGCGALVVPEETEAFAATVVRVLTDAGLRARLAARGRAYARTWSSVAMARRMSEIYEQLCAAPRSAARARLNALSRVAGAAA